jgi:hypothetical protein
VGKNKKPLNFFILYYFNILFFYYLEQIFLRQNVRGDLVLTHYKMSFTAPKIAKTHQTQQKILIFQKRALESKKTDFFHEKV